jgi:small basic protein
MILLPFLAIAIGLAIGFGAGRLWHGALPAPYADYVSIAILAGLDSAVGATRAAMNRQFNDYQFVTGFFTNAVVAVALAYVGDLLGVELYLAVVVAFGIRIFNNLGGIRALVVTRHTERRKMSFPSNVES